MLIGALLPGTTVVLHALTKCYWRGLEVQRLKLWRWLERSCSVGRRIWPRSVSQSNAWLQFQRSNSCQPCRAQWLSIWTRQLLFKTLLSVWSFWWRTTYRSSTRKRFLKSHWTQSSVKLSKPWARMEPWFTWNRPVTIHPFRTSWSLAPTMLTSCQDGLSTASKWACSLPICSPKASRRSSSRMVRRFDLITRVTTYSISLWAIWGISWQERSRSPIWPTISKASTSQASIAWRRRTTFVERSKQTAQRYAKSTATIWASSTLTSSATGTSVRWKTSGSLLFKSKIQSAWCQTQRKESTR